MKSNPWPRFRRALIGTFVIMIGGGAGPSARGAATSVAPASRPAILQTNWTALLRQARSAWRTNQAHALALCNQAVVVAGTNAAPWLMRASMFDQQREYATAVSDASAALQLEPLLADAWQLRGTLHFKAARFRESVQDFDRFLALVPAQRAHHWQRGISLYYAGDYDEGRKQFQLHESVNANDVENAVWHFLCVARARGVEAARAGLLKPGPDARVPMTEIHALFAGNGSAEAVLAAAERRSDDSHARFYAHLYLGLYFDALGDANLANEHMAKAVQIAPPHYMGDVARVHAGVLQQRKRP